MQRSGLAQGNGRMGQVSVRFQQSLFSGIPGHNDVKTTLIYTHVLNRGGTGVKSPVDDV